jgi:hypothetical protein
VLAAKIISFEICNLIHQLARSYQNAYRVTPEKGLVSINRDEAIFL